MATDPNEGWTVQGPTPYVDTEKVPDGYVGTGELPDLQSLAAQGVNLRAFYANLPVVD